MPEPRPAPEGTGAEEEPQAETVQEEVVRESAESVAELLDQWREEYQTTKDGERKRELAYRMVQLDLALGSAKLRPEQVKIAEAHSGVLGFYQPDSRDIFFTPEGLDLPAEHYRDVLIHESTHAGKITGHRILDEGLTQLETERHIGTPLRGIYESEKKKVEKAFGGGVPDAMELYDFENPGELVKFYLETAWHDRWEVGWKEKFADEPVAATERERARLFDRKLAEGADKIEERFKKATPNLYAKLKQLGFDFIREQREIFDELYVRDILEERKAA